MQWARQQSGRRLSVEAARPYVEAYLDTKKAEYQAGRLSAGTLQAKRSQISKLYRIDLTNYQLPKRTAPEKGRISAVVVAHGKHGRSRISEILPEDRQYITDIWDGGRIYDFLGPNDRVPTQAARREYAQSLYRAHCRDLTQLTDGQIYSCRDGSGRHFDREAVALVSQSLGHGSDRYTYVINNYLR